MYFKCGLLLFLLEISVAQLHTRNSAITGSCPFPRLEHGRFRFRQRAKLVQFSCYPYYQLVGNKYAICRDGKWDVALPVCVKPGCTIPKVDNAVTLPSQNNAWLMFFCNPGYKLVGSSAIFCDGRKWNGTVPVCMDVSAPPKLSCSFEEDNLCGWTQDMMHDFDWIRLNKATPSSVLFTGPVHDHTFGKDGHGYYMYIESTGHLINDTARLLSPIYSADVASDACFSFYYHMYGETTGGLRIYQKPENAPLDTEKQMYLLFEKWGDQGNSWFNAIVPLKDLSQNFQLVIEGIRGTSFTSDIAVDDVQIMNGANCSMATTQPTTTTIATAAYSIMPDSCVGRCEVYEINKGLLTCGCSSVCMLRGNCCPDFYDLCLFNPASSDAETTPDDASVTPEILSPRTQKLIASTTETKTTQTTLKTTTKPSTTVPTTTSSTTVTTSKTTTPAISTKRIVIKATTIKKQPTLMFKTTTQLYNMTGKIQKDMKKINSKTNVTKLATTKTTMKTTILPKTTTTLPFGISRTIEYHNFYREMIEKAKKEQMIEKRKYNIETKRIVAAKPPTGSSGGTRITLLVIAGLLCIAGATYLVVFFRSAKGRQTISQLRGHVQRDQAVRYLTTDVDDE